eukprot:8672264-Pyramimonas_sp.AAC.1
MRNYIKSKLISAHDLSWDSTEARGAGLTAEIIENLMSIEKGVPASGDLFAKLLEREGGLTVDIARYVETNQVAAACESKTGLLSSSPP